VEGAGDLPQVIQLMSGAPCLSSPISVSRVPRTQALRMDWEPLRGRQRAKSTVQVPEPVFQEEAVPLSCCSHSALGDWA
jgi:hypothetical protein